MTAPRLRGAMLPAAPDAAATELLVLLPSLGTTTALWDGVAARLQTLRPGVRILRVDVPGHGASPTVREPITIADLADGVLALVDEVGGGRFHVAGVSLGGAIALELALAHPDRVSSLAMFCSGARIGTAEGWAERAAKVRSMGTASLVAGSASRWFAPGFLDAHPDGPGGQALRALVEVDDEGYARCAEALATFDRTADLGALSLPTLIVSGEHDAVTTPESMAALAAAIPGAVYRDLAGTSHLNVLEAPEAAADLLATQLGAADARATGMAVRRAVLGDAHVDAANAGITPETEAFQDFITRYAWGEVWARPGLSRRDRSIATLAVLIGAGHEHEVPMHLRAALRNGLSREEISEVLLHTALYAGLPAANGAFRQWKDVLAAD